MNNQTDYSEPAFAHSGDHGFSTPQTGMTIRDWFAGQALAGGCGYPCDESVSAGNLVVEAYKIADAMLLQRRI